MRTADKDLQGAVNKVGRLWSISMPTQVVGAAYLLLVVVRW